MDLKEYVNKYNNSIFIMENEDWGTQCVALLKHYSENVLNIPLTSFGGSALTGWENEENTFPENLFKKVTNDFTNPEQVPPVGAMLFFLGGQYGHCSICIESYENQNKIKVFEQNVGNGNGKGYDDRAKISDITYKNLLGWYIKKEDESLDDIIDENIKLKEKLNLYENIIKDRDNIINENEIIIEKIKTLLTQIKN